MMTMEDRLLRIPEVATLLGVHKETVRRWVREGRLKGIMPGGQRAGLRIRESDLGKFLRRRELGGEPEQTELGL